MQAHAHDLRAEVADDPEILQHGDPDEWVATVARDWTAARLRAGDRAMLSYAVELTRAPAGMGEADIEALRAAGFDDSAVHEIVQIVGFFNYYNRIADGLGIAVEE
ncbi:peroxidase [Nannocystaceae bacterium ST9]